MAARTDEDAASSLRAKMAIYADDRVRNEMMELVRTEGEDALDDPLKAYQVECMHYTTHGEQPYEAFARVAGVASGGGGGIRIVDVGSGYGCATRALPLTYPNGIDSVTGVEIQEEVSRAASEITDRAVKAGKLPAGSVEHVCASVTDCHPAGARGAGDVSCALRPFHCGQCVLVLLHLPEAKRALAYKSIRSILKEGGIFYIEDYLDNGLTEDDRQRLASIVACPYVPTREAYARCLHEANLDEISFEDVGSAWAAFTRNRCDRFHATRERQMKVHGSELTERLSLFYRTTCELLESGRLTGVRVVVRAA